jgi:hypothetical protein
LRGYSITQVLRARYITEAAEHEKAGALLLGYKRVPGLVMIPSKRAEPYQFRESMRNVMSDAPARPWPVMIPSKRPGSCYAATGEPPA